MRHNALILFLAASSAAALAQTPAKPATPAATPAHHTATAAAASKTTPAGLPPVHGLLRTAFTLRYQEIKLGTGADAEPNKMYKVLYTGYLGVNGRPDDGHKFDSSDDHRQPERDKDGKPVLGDDGKPKLGEAQPMAFPQGMGRLIPGFDQGFYGMKVGGKRRLFIPWQLAYGAKGRPGPDAAHPGIPPKADLIFDVELVDVADMPAAPTRPGMGGRPMPPGAPGRPGMPPTGAAPGAAPGAPRPLTPAPAVPVPVTPPTTTAPAPATPPSKTTPPPSH
jgi:peptidylprolyl isomerase